MGISELADAAHRAEQRLIGARRRGNPDEIARAEAEHRRHAEALSAHTEATLQRREAREWRRAADADRNGDTAQGDRHQASAQVAHDAAERTRRGRERRQREQGQQAQGSTTTTRSTGGAMSISDDKAGIAQASELANQSLSNIIQGIASLEQSRGMLMQITEGSGRPEFEQAAGGLGQAIDSLGEAQQHVSSAVQEAENGAAAL